MSALRVLHVLHSLDRGGTETWLRDVVCQIDRRQIACDFVVTNGKRGAYEDEMEAAGARIFRCPPPARSYAYGRELTGILRTAGPYDIVHSHLDPCGYPLQWARRERVPVRIAHAHNPGMELRRHAFWTRMLLSRWTQRLISENATCGLATSRSAGESMFGRIRRDEWSWKVLYCGLNLDAFRRPPARRDELLLRLGMPPGSKVLLHVGKFCRAGQKNQEFVVEILAAMRDRCPTAVAAFVGDGPRRAFVERRALQVGVRDRVHFLGSRTDVGRLLTSLADVFVFPSRFEGLGLAVVEAEASGCPCLVSDRVPDDAFVVRELIHQLPLSAGAQAWSDRLAALLSAPPSRPADCWEQVAHSHFNIVHSARRLVSIYEEARHAASLADQRLKTPVLNNA